MNTRHLCHIVLAASAVLVLAGSAAAQQPRRSDQEQVRARQQISTMEGVFERAVKYGAENLLSQMRTVMPDGAILTDMPEVRGFRLEGYGVFFDVRMPGLLVSPVWSLRTMGTPRPSREMMAELEQLKNQLQAEPAGPARERMMAMIQRLESSLGLQERVTTRGVRGSVSAATVSGQGSIQPAAPAIDPVVLSNPDEAYTREVKNALIIAMLENSNALAVAADEWLTVAARDSVPRDPLVPGANVDFSTIVFRVKGRDLADFHARRTTLDEAKKRVEVTEH